MHSRHLPAHWPSPRVAPRAPRPPRPPQSDTTRRSCSPSACARTGCRTSPIPVPAAESISSPAPGSIRSRRRSRPPGPHAPSFFRAAAPGAAIPAASRSLRRARPQGACAGTGSPASLIQRSNRRQARLGIRSWRIAAASSSRSRAPSTPTRRLSFRRRSRAGSADVAQAARYHATMVERTFAGNRHSTTRSAPASFGARSTYRCRVATYSTSIRQNPESARRLSSRPGVFAR